MPENFNDTQTGGEGVTTQEGSKKEESNTIETPKIKPVDTKTEEPKVVDTKAEESKATKAPDKGVATQPEGVSQKPEVDTDVIENDLKEEEAVEIPMVAELPPPTPEYTPVPDDFSFEVPEEIEEPEIIFETPEEDDPFDVVGDPEREQKVTPMNAKEAQARHDEGYRLTGQYANTSRGGITGLYATGSTGFEMSLPEPEPEILKYGTNPQDYSVRDGEWYIRENAKSEWTKIDERWRVRTLNQAHGKNVPVPEETYKPVKGGELVDGVRVYGSSSRPGTTYTIRDSSWWRLPKDGEWEKVTNAKNIGSLNNEHGEKILTNEKKQEKSASVMPGTAGGVTLDELRTKEKNAEFEEKKIREDLKKTLGYTPEELAEVMRPNVDKAGDVLEKQASLGLKKTDIPIARDENYDAIINSSDYGDGLTNDTYPESKLGDQETFNQLTTEQSEWNDRQIKKLELEEDLKGKTDELGVEAMKEYHEAGGPTGSLSTTNHYTNKQMPPSGPTVMADMVKGLVDSSPEEREETMSNVTSAAKSFQEKIDKKKEEEEEEKAGKIIPFNRTFENEFERKKSQYDDAENILANHNLQVFIGKNIDEWAEETNLTPEQINGLKEVQEFAKSADINDAKYILAEVDEYLYQVRETNNKLAEAANRGKDLNQILTENKKNFYEKNKGIIKDEVGQLFMATLAIREFIDDYVDEGKIEIDSKGGYKVKDTVSASEKSYIEARLGVLLDKYSEAKDAMYSDNRKLISEKRKKIKSIEAALSQLKKDSTPENAEYIKNTVGQYTKELKLLRDEVKALLEDTGAIFQTDPEGLAKDASTSKSKSARSILKSLPDYLSAKQKFDLFYESLLEKTQRMAQDNDIDSGYFDRVGQRLRDILDWDMFGVALSDTEIEYFKNKATLTKLMPLYLNNDAGVTSESAGFFESFMSSLTAVMAPNISAAEGWIKDTDRVRAIQEIASMPILGVDPLELASITTMEQLRSRSNISGWSLENIGNLLGTTSGIMMAMIGGGGLTAGTMKLGKGMIKFLTWATKLEKGADIAKYGKRLNDAYRNAMKSTKMGKFFLAPIEEGKTFYLSGMWFNQQDGQLNFLAGFGGAVGGKLFAKLYKNMPPSALVEIIGRLFGASTDKAVIAMQKFGTKIRVAKAANYRGQGEIAQEFVQELTSIYYDELRDRGFWEEVAEKFGTIPKIVEFGFTSWTLGAMIGTAFADSHQDFIDSMSDSEYEMYQQLIKEASVDMATGKAAENMAAENIVNEEQGAVGEVEQTTEEVAPEKDATEDVSTEEDGDSIIAKTVEEAKAKWAEGYRIKGIDSEAGIDGMFATRGKKGINMTKPKPKERDFQSKVADAEERGLTLGEFAAEQEAEAEGDFKNDLADAKERGLTMGEFAAEQEVKQADKIETDEKSVGDKIRKGKFGDDISMVGIPGFKQAFNTAVEGVAIAADTIDSVITKIKNSDWYKKDINDEQRAKADSELEKIKAALKLMEKPYFSRIRNFDHTVFIGGSRGVGMSEKGDLIIEQLETLRKDGTNKGDEVHNNTIDFFISEINSMKELSQYIESHTENYLDVDGGDYTGTVSENVTKFSEKIQQRQEAEKILKGKDREVKGKIREFLKTSQAESDPSSPDYKRPEKLPTLGSAIRKGKLGDDITMAGIPGLKQAWNTAIEGIAVSVDTIGKIIERIQSSEWYQELEEKERKIANAELNKIAEGLVETGVKHKAPKTPTSQLQTIKDKINFFRKAYAEGKKAGKKLSKEEAADKKELIDWIQTELLSYARENLPKDKKYSQAEVTSMANKIRNATTPGELGKALNAIDKKMTDFQDAARVKSAKDLIKSFKNPQLKKRGEKKVSKIGAEADKEIKDLKEQNSDEDILNMTQEEISALKAKLDDIIDQGKTEVKDAEYAKKKGKREQRAVYHKELSKQTESQTTKLSGEKDINTFFAGGKGVIYIGDQVFSSKTAVKDYLKDNDLTYESIGEVDATYDAETYKNTVNRFTRATRRVTDILTMTGRTLESRIDDIARHSKTLRESLRTNITDATNEAYVLRDEARQEQLGVLYEALKPLGGFNKVTGGVSALEQDTGITIESPNPKSSINVDLAIKIRNMSMVEPSMIYRVGDSYYDSESEAKAEAESSGENLFEWTSKYNPYVLRQISQDGSLDSGLEKISEIEEYVESDEKIKTYADFLINTYYKDSKALFGDTYKDIYGKELPEGVYSPLNRVVDEGINTDLLRTDNNYSAVTAMSSSLKQRQNPKNLSRKFDLTVGATAEAMNYTNGMTQAKYFLPVAENYKNLINKTTRPELVAKIGEARVKRLETHMNDIISDGGTMTKQEGANILDAYLKYKVVTTLMLKPGSIIKQATSASHWLGAGLDDGVGTTQVLAQIVKVLPAAADMFSKDGAVSKKTLTQGEAEVVQKIFNGAFIKNRVTGKSIDYELSAMHKSIDGGKLRNATNMLSKVLLAPTIIGDAAGVLLGGVPFTLATYNNNIKSVEEGGKGMNHEEALNDAYLKFNKVAEHTQQSTRRDVISNAQKNQALRVLLTFKTSQTAAMSQLVKGAKVLTDYASGNKGDYTSAEALNAGRKVAYYSLSQAMFVMAANGTLGMIFGDDDDSDDPTRVTDRQKTAAYDAFMDTISSDLQGFGVPGIITDWTLNVLRGREAFNNIPTIELLEDIANVLGGSIEASMYGGDVLPFNESGSSDMSESTLKKMAKIVGIKNILQLGESMSQLAEGEIGYMDAWMGRTTEEVEENVEGATVIKNRKYKTGYEKKDALFEWYFGPEGGDPEGNQFPEKIDKELSGSEAETEMDSFDDILDDEKYLDELANPLVESKGGYKRDTKFETKARTKREKELKQKSLESKRKLEEKSKKNRQQSKPPVKISTADENKKFYKEWEDAKSAYEYKFKKKAPQGWSLEKIKNAVHETRKQ